MKGLLPIDKSEVRKDMLSNEGRDAGICPPLNEKVGKGVNKLPTNMLKLGKTIDILVMTCNIPIDVIAKEKETPP